MYLYPHCAENTSGFLPICLSAFAGSIILRIFRGVLLFTAAPSKDPVRSFLSLTCLSTGVFHDHIVCTTAVALYFPLMAEVVFFIPCLPPGSLVQCRAYPRHMISIWRMRK